MYEIEAASESLKNAIRQGFANTVHIHRLSPDIGKLVIEEILLELLKGRESRAAFKVLGDHFSKAG